MNVPAHGSSGVTSATPFTAQKNLTLSGVVFQVDSSSPSVLSLNASPIVSLQPVTSQPIVFIPLKIPVMKGDVISVDFGEANLFFV